MSIFDEVKGDPRWDTMHKWEYKVVREDPELLEDTLNDYGKEGWDLVTAAKDNRENLPDAPGVTVFLWRCIFKRQGRPLIDLPDGKT